MKKIIALCVLGLALFLLSSCTETRSQMKSSYKTFQKKAVKKNSQYKYFVKVMSPTTGKGYMIASAISYDDALNGALEGCRNQGVYDCIIHTRGNSVVYNPPSKEDIKIIAAQNTCKKVGYSEGTEAFSDCAIKILTQAKQQNSQTVIVGQRRIFPSFLTCRDIGMC